MLGTTVETNSNGDGSAALPNDRASPDTIIPTIEGNVLIHSDSKDGFLVPAESETHSENSVFVPSDTMRKTSVTARFLAENAPFISQDGVLFTGQKSNSVIGLGMDMATGELLSAVNILANEGDHGRGYDRGRDTHVPQDAAEPPPVSEFSGTAPVSVDSATLWFGRVDYGLRATSIASGQKYFDMTYGEWHPLVSSTSHQLAISDGREEEDVAAAALVEESYAVVSSAEGEVTFFDAAADALVQPRPALDLKSPVISAFAVRQRQIENGNMHGLKPQYSIRHLRVHHRVGPLSRSRRPLSDDDTVLVQSAHEVHSDRLLYAIGDSTPSPPLLGMREGAALEDDSEASWGVVVAAAERGPLALAAIPPRGEGLHAIKGKLAPLATARRSRGLPVSVSVSAGPLAQLTPTEEEEEEAARDYFEEDDDGFVAAEDDDYVEPADVDRERLALPGWEGSGTAGAGLKRGRYQLHPEPYGGGGGGGGGIFTPRQQMLIQNIQLEQQLRKLQTENEIQKSLLIHSNRKYQYLSGGGDGRGGERGRHEDSSSTSLSLLDALLNRHPPAAVHLLQLVIVGPLLVVLVLGSILFFGLVFLRFASPYRISLPSSSLLLQFIVLLEVGYRIILPALHINFLASDAGISLSSSSSSSSSDAASAGRNSKPRSNSVSLFVEYDEAGRKTTKVGSLAMYEAVLGFGSHGTVVFKGSLNGRPVAIKRMLSQFNKAAEREISLLIRSDGHPNVVRYFLKEEKSDFVYLALQLCEMSLK